MDQMLFKFFNFFPAAYLNEDLEYVSVLGRMFALMIDMIFLVIALRFLGTIFYWLIAFKPISLEVADKYKFQLPMEPMEMAMIKVYQIKLIIFNLMQFFLMIGLSIFCFHKWHTSPGAWLLKIKLLDEKTMQAPSTVQFSKRFLWLMLSFLPIGLGFFVALFSKKRQTFYDKRVGTIAVKARHSSAYLKFFTSQNNFINRLNRKIISLLPPKLQSFFNKLLIK